MVQIIKQCESLPCPEKLLTKTARAIYKGENANFDAATIIVLCSDYMIRKLNRQYRGKDEVTDVLSFQFGDPDLLGEIYISLHRAKIQARRYKVTYDEELKRLLVHGLLHLMGYDHIKKADLKIMEAQEQKY